MLPTAADVIVIITTIITVLVVLSFPVAIQSDIEDVVSVGQVFK
jgi:hypothetical protein